VLFTICFGVAVAQACEYDHGDGRPACIQAEMNRPWRNNWDPVHYWECLTLNTPAVAVRCPNEHLFLESALTCVPWSQWVWTPPCNPPSGGSSGGGAITITPPAPTCEYNNGDGRPACIQVEMNRPWRNNLISSQYWVCITLNIPAVAKYCPAGQAFLESVQKCVPIAQWIWTRPCNPPSGGIIIGTTAVTPPPTAPTANPGSCYYDHGNGRPLCIAQELNRPWRNLWDNTRYWVCQTLNTPAVEMVCGVNSLFLESAGTCVAVSSWKWTVKCNPPSTSL
jgi:hypothetical protein